MSQIQAKFTQGSILRHIVVMTVTSAIGLTFTFVIDFVTLLWISTLKDQAMTASVALAGALMFLTVSFSIAFMIPTVALVSRSLGRGDDNMARQFATGSLVLSALTLLVLALVIIAGLDHILPFLGKGASPQSIEYAREFLVIVLPSVFFFGTGITASAILRAQGDATRSMLVTVIGGAVSMVADPLLIVVLDGGVRGAAMAFVISRFAMAVLGLYYIGIKYDFLIDPRKIHWGNFFKPFFAIAIPALFTQASTPIGNIILTRAISPFGDDALEGFAVSFRVMLLGFGGVFALSGAIGGIIGQNYGARHLDRVREAYVKAIGFGAFYSLMTWLVLFLLRRPIEIVFSLTENASHITDAFIYSAWYFVFISALFVSNAAFNNLGRPLWSTGTNWLRDVVLTYPMLFVLVPIFGATGVMYTQAVVGAIAGSVAALLGWNYLNQVASGKVQVERLRL